MLKIRPSRRDHVLPGDKWVMPMLRGKIVQMIPPPTTLGGRAGNAAHRLSAFLQSLLLISGDFKTLQKVLSSLLSITTDLGVESLLTKLEPIALSAVLPYFGPAPTEADFVAEDRFAPFLSLLCFHTARCILRLARAVHSEPSFYGTLNQIVSVMKFRSLSKPSCRLIAPKHNWVFL